MIMLLRGRVVVREVHEDSRGALWVPRPGPRQVRTHTGRVLSTGAPARAPGGTEVPHGFGVGDLVQYHFTTLEEAASNVWEDGKVAHWIPQENVDAVWEDS